MSSRQVPFYKDAPCDECGKIGSFDFMGDHLCMDCAFDSIATEPEQEGGKVIQMPKKDTDEKL
jgi:hypothetical protein